MHCLQVACQDALGFCNRIHGLPACVCAAMCDVENWLVNDSGDVCVPFIFDGEET